MNDHALPTPSPVTTGTAQKTDPPTPQGTDRSQRQRLRALFAGSPPLPSLGPSAAIIGLVLLGNALFLIGVFNPNPLNVFSDLGQITHAGLTPGSYVIDPNNGFTSQSLGHLAAIDLLHGHIPWWNPYEGVGAPLAGEMQSAALFPGTILLAFSTGQLFLHILLESIAGLATYRLLLRLDISPWVSAACGAAFSLSGTFAWFGHAPVNPIAFLPVILLGAERARSATLARSAHGWGMISIGLASSLYAGFPEVAYLDGLVAVLWIAIRSIDLNRRQVVLYARKVVMGSIVGVLIAAPILVAFGDYLPLGDLGSHATGFNNTFLPHVAGASLLFPYSFGPIFGFVSSDKTGLLGQIWGNVGGYLTTSILVFDLIALYNRRLRPLRFALAIWMIFSLGRTYGIEPFAKVFDLLPLMNHIAAYRYLPPSWEFAAIALAGLGLEDLRQKSLPTWYLVAAIVTSALIAIGALVGGGELRAALDHAQHYRIWAAGSFAWGFGVLIVIAAGTLLSRGRARTVILLACLLLDVLMMFAVPELSAPRQASIDGGSVVWLQHHLGDQRFYSLGPIAPNYGSYFGIASANINDLPVPKSYGRYITHSLNTNENPLLFTGTSSLDPSGPTAFQEFRSHLSGYEAIGVAYLVSPSGLVARSTAHALHLRLVYSDPLVNIYRLPAPRSLYSVTAGNCALTEEGYGRIDADCTRKTVVLRRELSMPGWSATVNGHPARLGTAGVFQTIVLEPGNSVVVFSFLPPHERGAFAALLVGLILLAWGSGAGMRRQVVRSLANGNVAANGH